MKPRNVPRNLAPAGPASLVTVSESSSAHAATRARFSRLAVTLWCAGLISACSVEGKPVQPPSYVEQVYIKAYSTHPGDQFGFSIALSADGSTLAVGANNEGSGNPNNPRDQTQQHSGAVYVYTRTGETWKLEKYIKASPIVDNSSFGVRVALSEDGSILAVGANGESDLSDPETSGAAYVFSRQNGWSQQARLSAHLNRNEQFGLGLALSADGKTLAIGAPGPGPDVNVYPPTVGANDPGTVYVYKRSGTSWGPATSIQALNGGMADQFGYSVALSDDGSTLVVGAIEADGVVKDCGAAYVFTAGGSGWTQSAKLQAPTADTEDWFGASIALSGDGTTVAVGAHLENSSGSDPADNSIGQAGAVYVFKRNGSPSTWSPPAYLKAQHPGPGDKFGVSIAMSPDGQRLAIGAAGESSGSKGVDGDQANDDVTRAGAAYIFTRDGDAWNQSSYVKASNPGREEEFGSSIALSRAPYSLAVGAVHEGGTATGIYTKPPAKGGMTMNQGAAYVLERFSQR